MDLELDKGDIIAGRYRVEELTQEDFGSDVWRGYDLILRRFVDLRIVNHTRNSHQLQQFERGSQVLARLEHPHILPIYDYGIFKEHPYQISRHLSRGNYSDYIDSLATMQSTQEVLQFLQRIASALDYIHSEKIVHRTLSGSHILLDDQLQPYLTNFGLATTSDGIGLPITTASESVSNYVDLYSFGVLMFLAFTNKLPNTQYTVINEKIREHRPDLPVGASMIVQYLTHHRNEASYYQSAGQAVEDLYKAFYSGQSEVEGKIFISYARKDSEYVHSLTKELRRIGLDIWIDLDIEPGSNWDEAIENGLNDCDMMLLITTDASMSSEYVTHEWSYFMGGGKPVYPFIPQEPIPNNIHPRLSRVQHVVGTDDMLNNVARIVDVLAGGTPTKLGGAENQG